VEAASCRANHNHGGYSRLLTQTDHSACADLKRIADEQQNKILTAPLQLGTRKSALTISGLQQIGRH
jgi:hypothetical protein